MPTILWRNFIKAIIKCVFDLQPRRVYQYSKLSEMKNQILSSLGFQTMSNFVEELYVCQGEKAL